MVAARQELWRRLTSIQRTISGIDRCVSILRGHNTREAAIATRRQASRASPERLRARPIREGPAEAGPLLPIHVSRLRNRSAEAAGLHFSRMCAVSRIHG